jgi:hypothetical protein
MITAFSLRPLVGIFMRLWICRYASCITGVEMKTEEGSGSGLMSETARIIRTLGFLSQIHIQELRNFSKCLLSVI